MRYIYPIVLVLLLVLSSCEKEVSEAQADQFLKFYGQQYSDEARDIEVLEDGSYAICGVDSVPGVGKRMMLLITDAYGNLKPGFPKYFTEDDLPSGANALLAKRGGQGGFLLCGYIERPRAGSTSQRDLFLVRISSSGKELWKKSYGSAEDETILHAAEGLSSGFMLAGYQVKDGKKDIMVMGVNEEGDSIQLSINYNNPNAANASANYILNTGNRYLCLCTYDRISDDGTDMLVMSFDDELSPSIKVLDGSFDEYARAIEADGENSYLLLGNRVNTSSGKEEIVIYSVETNGLLVTGSTQITTISETNANLRSARFVNLPDGSFGIVGTQEQNGNSDIFLQFLLDDYQLGERVLFGASGDQTGVDIALPGDGSILLLGTNKIGDNSMISLLKTDLEGKL